MANEIDVVSRGISNLYSIAKGILETLKNGFGQIIQSITILSKTIEEGIVKLIQEMSSLRNSQMETNLLIRAAEIKAKGDYIFKVNERIDEQKERLISSINKTHNKYNDFQNEAEDDFEKYIRDIGKDIFELYEELFGDNIERRIGRMFNSTAKLSHVEALPLHMKEIVDTRKDFVDTSRKSINKQVNDIENTRWDFKVKMREKLFRNSTNIPENFSVPFLIVEMNRKKNSNDSVIDVFQPSTYDSISNKLTPAFSLHNKALLIEKRSNETTLQLTKDKRSKIVAHLNVLQEQCASSDNQYCIKAYAKFLEQQWL